MKQLTAIQINLLHILGDGLCHSGNKLGQVLGVTRSAIWKQINQLIELGIPIHRLAQQGYQLPGALVLLNEEQIKNTLKSKGFSKPYALHLFTTLDSTNRYLKDLAPSTFIDVCCAELQTQGKGRFSRHWHSPFGENLYFSCRWNLNCDLSRLSGLSLVTSLAVLKTINELKPCPEIKIKWPNDLLWRDKKLCGSLIEILAESNSNAQVIIGIGLNVNTDTQNHPLPDKPWCSLFEIFNEQFDRNKIIANLLTNLLLYLDKFINNGLTVFLDEWDKNDYLAGKQITVNQSLSTHTGIAKGINEAGQLILEDEKRALHLLSSGDTSIASGFGGEVRPEQG